MKKTKLIVLTALLAISISGIVGCSAKKEVAVASETKQATSEKKEAVDNKNAKVEGLEKPVKIGDRTIKDNKDGTYSVTVGDKTVTHQYTDIKADKITYFDGDSRYMVYANGKLAKLYEFGSIDSDSKEIQFKIVNGELVTQDQQDDEKKLDQLKVGQVFQGFDNKTVEGYEVVSFVTMNQNSNIAIYLSSPNIIEVGNRGANVDIERGDNLQETPLLSYAAPIEGIEDRQLRLDKNGRYPIGKVKLGAANKSDNKDIEKFINTNKKYKANLLVSIDGQQANILGVLFEEVK